MKVYIHSCGAWRKLQERGKEEGEGGGEKIEGNIFFIFFIQSVLGFLHFLYVSDLIGDSIS